VATSIRNTSKNNGRWFTSTLLDTRGNGSTRLRRRTTPRTTPDQSADLLAGGQRRCCSGRPILGR
jgi:hypothetical protein